MVTLGIQSLIYGAMADDKGLVKPKFIPGETRIPLNVLTYGAEEVIEALDSLMSTWVTMGKKVKRFEEMWAEYIGVKHAIMTNSGSSANLLALASLNLPPGAEVITPAVTWATTVFPIAQLGLVPVLVDVDLDTYNINIDAVLSAITEKTRVIMPVHLLGNPCNMNVLGLTAPGRMLNVIEDACEAHGAEFRGRKVGAFGELGTFSFFFSHHISTIEGGMIVTSDDELADKCRSLRSFGWIRDQADASDIKEQYPNIDPRFLFQHAGYNMRPTEIQGAFGMHQLPRLDGFIEQRRENAAYWNEALKEFEEYLMLPSEQPGTKHTWFAYPFLLRPGCPLTRKEFQQHLESRGVESRQIEAGNMAIQPAMQTINYRVSGSLENAQYIHDNGFFIGCHSGIGESERQAVVDYCAEFFQGFREGR